MACELITDGRRLYDDIIDWLYREQLGLIIHTKHSQQIVRNLAKFAKTNKAVNQHYQDFIWSHGPLQCKIVNMNNKNLSMQRKLQILTRIYNDRIKTRDNLSNIKESKKIWDNQKLIIISNQLLHGDIKLLRDTSLFTYMFFDKPKVACGKGNL